MINLFQRMVHSVIGIITTLLLMAAPVLAIAYAATASIDTAKSYNMDEYLSLLATTEQREKYEQSIQLANYEAVDLNQLSHYDLAESGHFRVIKQKDHKAWGGTLRE